MRKFTCNLYLENGKKKCLPPKGWQNTESDDHDPTQYGILCGKKSNIIVVDFDHSKKDSVSGMNFFSFCQPIYTYTVKTGSNGRHLYFKYTDKIKSGNSTNIFEIDGKPVSIDIRSDGGFVIGAGSQVGDLKWEVLHDLPIAEMPDWLIEMINNKYLSELWKPIKKPVNEIKNEIINVEIDEGQLEQKLASIDKSRWDDYNTWLNLGIVIFNLIGDIDVWRKFSKLSDKYDPESLEFKWNSFKSDKTEKLGWNYLNGLVRRDNPERFKIISAVGKFESKKMFDINYFMQLWVKNPNKNKKSEEYKNHVLQVQKEFAKYFVICLESGIALIYYIREYTTKNYKYFALCETDLKRFQASLTPRDLLNPMLVTHVNFSTVNPVKPIIYEEDGKLILNRFIRPEWDFGKLEEWIKTKGNAQEQEKVEKWIDNHLLNVVCGGNKEDFKFLVNWIGNTLFKYDFNPQIAIILRSEETGTGKSGLIKKIFQEYFGQAYGLKDDSNFSGKGAMAPLMGKLFGLLEEVHIETKEDYNKLKTLISEDSVTYEAKFQNSITVPNYCKFILTTNNTRAIKHMASNERRFAEFNLKSHLTHGTGYFDVYNCSWQYWTYYFRKYQENVNFARYKTSTNANNTKIMLKDQELFICNEILANYSAYPKINDQRYAIFPDLYDKYAEKFSIKNKSLFHTYFLDRNVFIGEKIRKRFDGKQYVMVKLNTWDNIIRDFKNRNSGVNPIDEFIICERCKTAKAVKEVNDIKYCNVCVPEGKSEDINY